MRLALALALVAAACGNGSDTPDAPPVIDAVVPPDAVVAATFTTFVIDLIVNQTSSMSDPVPYAAFATLPDPDLDNPAAYDSLFQ